MASNFSITEDRLTPIRPQKIERLFNSPSAIITPSKIINDRTYRVTASSQPREIELNQNDFDNTIGLDHVDRNLLRQSTCLKGDKPLLDKTNLSSQTVASDLLPDSTDRSIAHDNIQIPQYKPFYQVKDIHPIRATCFHPGGEVFAIGTNSKSMKIFMYPTEEELQNFDHDTDTIEEPEFAFQFIQIHRGSVYCVAFNQNGSLIATGSNDQTVHVIRYNSDKHKPEGNEHKLKHSGTIRDLCFINDGTENNSSSMLVAAGAGEFELNIFDCNTSKRVHKFQGHESTVMSLHQWNDSPTFVSGSLDGTIRIWDLRGRRCCSSISTNKPGGDQGNPGSGTPVGVTRIEPTGKLLVSGHTDGRCMLYDIRAGRVVQLFRAHDEEVRTLNFSPKSYYLLTASYDHKIKLMDLQGDLTRKIPSVEIAELNDKVIQTAWHPTDYNFVTTSADGSATLWTMP